MIGTELIQRVRTILRDTGENTLSPNPNMLNSVAGQFWGDYEVLTALNVAQDFLINRAIQGGIIEHLNMLVVRGQYTSQNANNVGIPRLPMPADFLHYIDAMVGPQNSLRIARVYYGSDGVPYVHVRHCALYIFGDFYTMNDMGNFNTGGVFNYYRRPSMIVSGYFPDSFLPHIYYQDIVRYASSLLGTKEIHTQRDFKNYDTTTKSMKIKPPQPAVVGSLEL